MATAGILLDSRRGRYGLLTLILQVLGVAGGLTGLATLVLRYANPAHRIEEWVKEDQEYRSELAQELRGSQLGGLYQHVLATSLDWLDRRFGFPESPAALGFCIIIALYYAYAAFFLAWGIGGPGDIGGVALLPEAASLATRLVDGLLFASVPAIAFCLGFTLVQQELRIQGFCSKCLNVSLTNNLYNVLLPVVILVAFLCFFDVGFDSIDLAAAMLITIGPTLGAAVSIRIKNVYLRVCASMLAGLISASVFYVTLLMTRLGGNIDVPGVLEFAVSIYASIIFWLALCIGGVAAANVIIGKNVSAILAAGLAVVLTGAGAGGEAFFAGLLKAMGAAMIAEAASKGRELQIESLADVPPLTGFFGAMAAGAVAAATGALAGLRMLPGAVAGGMGGLLGLGILMLSAWPAANEIAVVLIVLFLALPLVNGLWDWLSWWVSRQLGRDLLAKLGASTSTGRRTWTVAWHASADLIAAALLLATLAYLLAFAFAAYNQLVIALSYDGTGAFDLDFYIERAAAAPWTDGLWLTVMLISTLVPTFLHLVILLASPIALVVLPTTKRLSLADDLETYDAQPERQASIRRRAGQYVAREKHAAIALATFLIVVLLATLSGLVSATHRGLAHYVLEVARAGIWTARWIAGVF